MASTKIINVLKDDKFEEILDLFKNTSAKEVIFVLPKTSRAFKNEEHFVILENEAQKMDKKISLLCSNSDTNKLAKKYQFDVLLAKDGEEKREEEDEKELEPEQKENTEEAAMYQGDSEENDQYQIVTVSKIKRGLEDIVKQSGTQLKVALQKERSINLDVKKKPIHQPLDDIKSVWKRQKEYISGESIWTGINNRTKKSFRNFPKKSLVGLGIISVVLLGTIIYISTGSAKIDITPNKQPLDIQLKVSSSDKFSSVDTELNKIPGQLFNVEKNATQTFPTTGEKEVAQKARGKITVFNEYGTTVQVLIATTRFQTPDGLIFRTLKNIVVPGTKVENGKIIAGSINVEVIADKPGQSYNIPATKFSIPAFNERDDAGRYEKIYGRSDEEMKGGALGKAKVVSDVDFNTAQQTLSDQIIKAVEESIKTQTSGLKVINDFSVQLKEPESTAKIDEAADSFMMAVSGSIKIIGFKDDDLKDLIKKHVDKTKNLTVIPEKLTINYSNVTFDDASNTLSFTVAIKGNGYLKVDANKIKADLSGKNEKEIKDYFKENSVGTVKVALWPFWVKRIPQDQERTKLQINY